MFKSYPKIEGLFKRKDGSKELEIGNFRNDYFNLLKDIDWVATEKIDGTNVCVEWDGHDFHFHGHTEKSELHKDLISYLEKTFDEVMEEKVEELFGDKQVNFYGEGYGAGIQKGIGYSDEKKFILFDVYFPETENWMNFYNMQDVGEKLGIEVVPVVDFRTTEIQKQLEKYVDTYDYENNMFLGTGFAQSIFYVCENHKTQIGKKEQDIEGLVLRPKYELKDNRGNRIIVKIKCCDFQPVKNLICE